jgi:hypothetical protein
MVGKAQFGGPGVKFRRVLHCSCAYRSMFNHSYFLKGVQFFVCCSTHYHPFLRYCIELYFLVETHVVLFSIQ